MRVYKRLTDNEITKFELIHILKEVNEVGSNLDIGFIKTLLKQCTRKRSLSSVIVLDYRDLITYQDLCYRIARIKQSNGTHLTYK